MAKSEYLTSPVPSERLPAGIPYIVGNEAAERFSFYGMRTILVIFMTKHLLGSGGELDVMSEEDAKKYSHLFVSAAYFFPLLGALVADIFLGKYRTIVSLSFVYCLGHLALALDETRLGLAIGLSLIAIGSGGIKPCVSAHVGDQFGSQNQPLLTKVFGWFYFSINLGAFASTLLTPILLEQFGPRIAFGVPGVLMFLATVVFWSGRRVFIHVPPGGLRFIQEAFSAEGIRAASRLAIIYVFVAMFWALFDQTGSAWVLQASKMNLRWCGIDWLPSQIQAANPILVLVLIPTFSYGLYPAISRVFPLTPLRKISIGLLVTVIASSIPALIEERIFAGETPSIGWQILGYVILTSAEVMVSITALEFSYTQAPPKMKSFIMALFLLSVSLGNLFVSAVNSYIQNEDGPSKLEGASYYWFFTAVMLAFAIGFIFVARKFQERTYIQGED